MIFSTSDAGGINESELLNKVENKYDSDISFYVNKQLFDYNKCEGSLLFTPLKYFNMHIPYMEMPK